MNHRPNESRQDYGISTVNTDLGQKGGVQISAVSDIQDVLKALFLTAFSADLR